MIKKIIAVGLALTMAAAIIGCKKEVTFNENEWNDMEIRVAGYRLFNDDPLNYEYAAGADKFSEKYGTKVEFLVGGGDGLGDDLVSGIMSGDPWEIQFTWGISVFPTTFCEELYTPVTDYIDFENNDMIDKITVDGTYWKGEYYGVSALPMQEVWYLAYNETWMKELGLKTPYEYYKEGNWNMDAYKELNAAAWAKGASSKSEVRRPHTGRKYMCKWNEETGEVTVTYDSQDNFEWLGYWGELLTNPKYKIDANYGYVGGRDSIMIDNVMPGLMKGELGIETGDTVRYINFPNADGKPGTYLTDCHFLFPQGVPEDKLPCAFMLACYMVDSKANMTDELYRENMNEEDYELWQENLENAYMLPRMFYEGAFAIGDQFIKDMKAGKAVATHIAENTDSLKAKAEEFNKKYVDGFEAE